MWLSPFRLRPLIDQLVIEGLADDLVRAEAELAASRARLVEIIADLTLENAGLRLLVAQLNKGVRVERDKLRAELERYTEQKVGG